MPEPLIGESITDIDRVESGELEFDLTAIARRTASPSRGLLSSSLEVEWGATKQLGLTLEMGLSSEPIEPTARVGAAWALLHDVRRDLHLQMETSVQLLREETPAENAVETGDSPLLATFDLRGGLRRNGWTLRSALGAGVGRGSRHSLPLRAEVAVFAEIRPSESIGFAGIETDVDWARRNPVLLAPTVVFGTVPLRVGFALLLSASRPVPPPGFFLRLIYEPH